MPRSEPFDIKRPLVAARAFRFAGVEFKKGDKFDPKGFSDRLVARQYEVGSLRHSEDAADDEDQLVHMEGPRGGRYTITAPWLDEPEVIRGKTNADQRFHELSNAGPPEGWTPPEDDAAALAARLKAESETK